MVYPGGGVSSTTIPRLIAAFSRKSPLLIRCSPRRYSSDKRYSVNTLSEPGNRRSSTARLSGWLRKETLPSTLRPAFVTLSDRVLAVLDGSTIGPDSSATRIGLLSVLDSQLTGPRTIPANRVGRKRGNPGVPPLLEIINSNPPLSNPSCRRASRRPRPVVIRATGALNGILPVDRALLEASAPLLVLVNSTMTTTGHFADLSGAAPGNSRGLLSASLVPGDALIRLDASRLTVNGNLFNLANGASASVTGHLFSLTNGSALTVNGVLVNLAGNSVLNLTSTAFGVFGPGANVLTINNNFCSRWMHYHCRLPDVAGIGWRNGDASCWIYPLCIGPRCLCSSGEHCAKRGRVSGVSASPTECVSPAVGPMNR